jgi:SET domain-containing protein
MFINHSKENANVKPGKYWTPKGPLILFLAVRQIKMNEEILYDYGDQYNGRELFK